MVVTVVEPAAVRWGCALLPVPAPGPRLLDVEVGVAREPAAVDTGEVWRETVPVIEQAKGILMAQYRCGPEEAFELLRGASQRANVKVRVLATRMVEQISSP
jgi:hypothetical protein